MLSHEAGRVVKMEGGNNDLVERVKLCEYFAPIHSSLNDILDPVLFIGRAPEQVKFNSLLSRKIVNILSLTVNNFIC